MNRILLISVLLVSLTVSQILHVEYFDGTSSFTQCERTLKNPQTPTDRKSKKLPSTTVDNLSVISKAGNTHVLIKSSSEPDVQVDIVVKAEKHLLEKVPFTIEHEDKTLTVKIDQIITLEEVCLESNITIHVPKNFIPNIEIDVSVGNLNISNIEANNFNIKDAVADVSLTNIKVSGDVNIDIGPGDLNIQKSQFLQKTIIQTSTCDFNVFRTNFNELIVNGESGDIKIEESKISTNLNVQTESGDIQCTNMESFNSDLRTSSGTIHVEDLRNQHLEMHSISGSIFAKNIQNLKKLESITISGDQQLLSLDFHEIDSVLKMSSSTGSIVTRLKRAPSTIEGENGPGDLTIYVPSYWSGKVNLYSAIGEILIRGFTKRVHHLRNTENSKIGSISKNGLIGNSSLSLKTSSGDIKLIELK